MSWDAQLTTRGHTVGDWNYTHNTSCMIYDCLGGRPDCGPWYLMLDELTGEGGAIFLGWLIAALESDPDHFRSMDPPNRWGSYDTLLPVLREMRDMSQDWPEATWWAAG